MRWFCADLHFGHVNVIRYSARPFHDVGEMNAALVGMWNSLVRPDDEIWVLGDVAMGRIDESLRFSGQLVGRKHLVLGNHDRPFDRRRRQEWTDRYLADGGFEELHHGVVDLRLADGTEVAMCHFPYEGDSGRQDRYLDARPPDDGRWLLHGHVHEKWRQCGRMINVGVDGWAGRPVAENVIVELIRQGPRNIDPIPWN